MASKKTTDDAVNAATVEERKILLHTFHLFPTFYFDIRQGDTNAYAEPPHANEDADGTIVFGVDLIRREITRSGGTARNFSVPAIMGTNSATCFSTSTAQRLSARPSNCRQTFWQGGIWVIVAAVMATN